MLDFIGAVLRRSCASCFLTRPQILGEAVAEKEVTGVRYPLIPMLLEGISPSPLLRQIDQVALNRTQLPEIEPQIVVCQFLVVAISMPTLN